jgi:transposase
MRIDPRTRDYVKRRLAEGKTKREIIRCLKRFVAREVFHAITDPHEPIPTGTELRAHRKNAGINLVTAAIGAGVSYPQPSQIERGITQHPNHPTRPPMDHRTPALTSIGATAMMRWNVSRVGN